MKNFKKIKLINTKHKKYLKNFFKFKKGYF